MSLSIIGTKTALGPGLTASFLASGGTAPYVYSVIAGGAGGAIDASTGVYTAPATLPTVVGQQHDTVQVTDADSSVATVDIMVGDALLLFCEIIQQEMGLAPGRVWIWDQKIIQPTDSDIYIAVSEMNSKPFSNVTKPALIDGVLDWSQSIQYVSMQSTLDIDAISRSQQARTRKEEIIMALNSIYSQQQQESNSFYIGRLPANSRFQNLSMVDGAAIPYRYKISVNIQYTITKQKSVPYFDTFQGPDETINA